MTATPRTAPARFPAEYGQTEETPAMLLVWDDVAERIAASPNYWLATSADDGHPHLRPVDGVFVDATLAFGGSPATRWVRHLQRRSAVSVSLPDDDYAVVLEGDAVLVTDPSLAISEAVGAANIAKCPRYYADGPGFRPFWALQARTVFAWTLTGFPAHATRFDFDHAPDPR